MSRLNSITVCYLKLLELVSFVLIKLDPLFSSQRISSEHQQQLHPHEPRWLHNDQSFESSPLPSSSDSESLGSSLPDYYFDRYDPRSPFYYHFPDSDIWGNPFTGLDNHHSPDPFVTYCNIQGKRIPFGCRAISTRLSQSSCDT